jgi:hypothetical protein
MSSFLRRSQADSRSGDWHKMPFRMCAVLLLYVPTAVLAQQMPPTIFAPSVLEAAPIPVLLKHGANVRVREEKYHGTPPGWANYAGHSEVRD